MKEGQYEFYSNTHLSILQTKVYRWNQNVLKKKRTHTSPFLYLFGGKR